MVKKKATEPGVWRGKKRQISFTIMPDLLKKVDDVAARTGQSRAALINMAIYQAVEGNLFPRKQE